MGKTHTESIKVTQHKSLLKGKWKGYYEALSEGGEVDLEVVAAKIELAFATRADLDLYSALHTSVDESNAIFRDDDVGPNACLPTSVAPRSNIANAPCCLAHAHYRHVASLLAI